ncbi:hypothetical protein Tco_0393164, partial [Tanacetum coccineum]
WRLRGSLSDANHWRINNALGRNDYNTPNVCTITVLDQLPMMRYESRNVEYSDKVLLHLEMVLLGLVDRNNADVIPCKVSYADDSINLNVDKSTIPSDPILQSVVII